jgi:hypothetical protein
VNSVAGAYAERSVGDRGRSRRSRASRRIPPAPPSAHRRYPACRVHGSHLRSGSAHGCGDRARRNCRVLRNALELSLPVYIEFPRDMVNARVKPVPRLHQSCRFRAVVSSRHKTPRADAGERRDTPCANGHRADGIYQRRQKLHRSIIVSMNAIPIAPDDEVVGLYCGCDIASFPIGLHVGGKELCITRQTLHRFVSGTGELREDGLKLHKLSGQNGVNSVAAAR